MSRADPHEILRDSNIDIGDHLHSHIHLTNFIHLKNHMHKKSPVLASSSLVRDLVALQRSRSLRDPSMSPSAWRSPSVVDELLERVERDSSINNRRRSIGVDHPRYLRGMLGSSPIEPLYDLSGHNDWAVAATRNHSNSKLVECRTGKTEVLSVGDTGTNSVAREDKVQGTRDGLTCDSVSGSSKGQDRVSRQTVKIGVVNQTKLIPLQSKELTINGEDACTQSYVHSGSRARRFRLSEEAEPITHPQHGNPNRGRRCRFRATRRTRASTTAIDAGAKNKIYVASNSLAPVAKDQIYHCIEGYDAHAIQNASTGPRKGCGIPFNWSGIHHKGRSFIDRAGKSLSCGLSDSRFRKGTMHSLEKDNLDIPTMSENSGSSSRPDAEGLPLLFSASVSQGSTGNASQAHDYSGELGIYTENLLRHEIDSDLASEARFDGKEKRQGKHHGRHQSFTQKYMPRNFRDLIGQHLVVQALSNAAVERKAGLVYVFYGPHGTGKTSTACIFAKSLNCHSLEHPKPCGVCKSCIAHDTGKSQNIREIRPVNNIDYESIMYLLDDMVVSRLPFDYRILIFDDCETLTPESWRTIAKVIDRAPRRAVFVLVCSSLDRIPYNIISRCQKFFFSKLKDADIIYTLQWIATKEDLQIDSDALKLIASKSGGSLRDAEMTLEQLSLLGQRISIPLVQEMVGLISDEKLVELLDFALSADTVNTVKNLRDIMKSSVDPLTLMPQLATLITDILSGGYNFKNEGYRRQFFHCQPMPKEDIEKLRHALKTLSEAEKHLRMSNDRLTWITTAVLQLAPEQKSLLLKSSTDTSFNSSPIRVSNSGDSGTTKKSNAEQSKRPSNKKALPAKAIKHSEDETSGAASYNANFSGINIDRSHLANDTSSHQNRASGSQLPRIYDEEKEKIWSDVLEQIRVNSIKEFLYGEGKLISVSFGAAPTVQLAFSSDVSKSTAERFKTCILQAFESVLGVPVTIEIQCRSVEDVREKPLIMLASSDGSQIDVDISFHARGVLRRPLVNSYGTRSSEIVELDASPKASNGHATTEDNAQLDIQNRSSLSNGAAPAQNHSLIASSADQKQSIGINEDLSLIKGKLSLGHVIQHSEGCPQQSRWPKRKAVSIAKKLEQENLRMEPKSRSLFCWKVTKINQKKKPCRWKIRTRKPRRLLRFIICGKCVSSK
ncbi:DNA-directed DNA polymerase [Lithospermum erythrorhizon]|uniref:DNA-directed DNA polymerase n=1 Tax=Lithospermum erythrorhizon TaxID=34254 RepID=A0AAV3PKQ0_LITER